MVPERSATNEPLRRGRISPAHGLEVLEHVVEQGRAPRLGHQLGAEAHQAPRRHQVLEADPAGAVVDDLLHPSLAQRQQLGDHAEVLLGNVDGHTVERLVDHAVDLAGQHLACPP